MHSPLEVLLTMNFRFGPSALLALTAACTLALTGCAMNTVTDPTGSYRGSAIQGTAHGGYQPLTGAHIYLFAAANTGYGAASTSLLTAGDGTDATGTYVLTTTGGGFNITGDYTCTTGQQVYLLATGGNPGLTPASYSNSAATLMAALGTCPSSGSFAGQIPFLTVNEVSTVAAAYSLAGFTIDPTHIGSAATTQSKAGLVTAFNNIFNMINLNYGQAYTTTPAVSGYNSASGLSANGTVPRSKIYTLADVAAGCVNSTGPTSAACTSFFNNTADSSGTKPTTIAQALINLAHNPANTYNFLNLSTGTSPFQPTLTVAPNDWSLSIQYTTPTSSHPGKPAIDAAGNIWIPQIGSSTLTELNPQGVVFSGVNGFTGSGLSQPDAAAVDASGNIWVSNYRTSGIVSEFNSNGSQASVNGYTTANSYNYDVIVAAVNVWFGGFNSTSGVTPSGGIFYNGPTGRNVAVAADNNDNIWSADYNLNRVTVLYQDVFGNNATRNFSFASLNKPAGMAFDASNNLWVANGGANTVSKTTTGLNGFGTPTIGTNNVYSVGGILQPYHLEVDGGGTIWVGNSNGSLTHLTSGGVALSPTTGFTTASTSTYSSTAAAYLGFFPASAIYGLAIAPSGDVWATDIDGSIYQFVGMGTPTTTPKSYATTGTKP